jgi:ABC-2 type transport system ATP-binding protein
MQCSAIKIENLVKVYKKGTKDEKLAVRGLSLEIKKGEFVGILGPNGAGKSTTIHCITGVSEPTSGSIKVFGQDVVTDYKNARTKIGLSPQEFNIDFFAPVEDVLYYQAGFFGIVGEERAKRVEEMLNIFELQEHRKKKFNFLSGGLKRRTVVAKALIHNPEIIILDEPTAGVDVETRQAIWKYLKMLNAAGKTIILTSHYLEEIEEMCERVVIIKSGEIVYDEKIAEAMKDGRLEKKYLEITQTLDSKNVKN